MNKSDVVIPAGMERFYSDFHFAPAVKDGDRLYCSGMIGIDAAGKCPDDPEKQFTLAFELVKAVLSAAGRTFADVVDMTTFHVGLRTHIQTFSKVKDRYLREPYPTWTAIGVSELAFPGGLVEVKITARI